MTVSGILIVVMAVLFACGVYAMLERSLTRVLIGFLLLGNATNLLLLIVMGAPGAAPFAGTESPEGFSDPLPQALMLTAIVITFAVSAFLLALIYRSWQLDQADTVADDLEDLAVRSRGSGANESVEAIADEDDDATTDFIEGAVAPLVLLGSGDVPQLRDDAPVDRASGASVDRSSEDTRNDHPEEPR